jgi:hypothetical protein
MVVAIYAGSPIPLKVVTVVTLVTELTKLRTWKPRVCRHRWFAHLCRRVSG